MSLFCLKNRFLIPVAYWIGLLAWHHSDYPSNPSRAIPLHSRLILPQCHRSWTILHPHQRYIRASISPQSCQQHMFLHLWIFANLIDEKCYLSIVLICISFVLSNVHFEWAKVAYFFVCAVSSHWNASKPWLSLSPPTGFIFQIPAKISLMLFFDALPHSM